MLINELNGFPACECVSDLQTGFVVLQFLDGVCVFEFESVDDGLMLLRLFLQLVQPRPQLGLLPTVLLIRFIKLQTEEQIIITPQSTAELSALRSETPPSDSLIVFSHVLTLEEDLHDCS